MRHESTATPAAGIIDLSANAKFRLSGGDRVRYLNGQVSNDVRKAGPDRAIAACVTTAKGKLNALVHIALAPDGESFLIDAPSELRESLGARLERYLIADDCVLDDVSEEFALVHVLGGTQPSEGIANPGRFGVPGGRDHWIPACEREDVLGRLVSEEMPVLSAEEAENLRIRQGIPAWGSELGEDTLPAEARLDAHAIDFHKGCYVGQEVISRIKSVGRVNRLLVVLRAEGELAPGSTLATIEGVEIGVLTSCTGKWGLGYVKRDFAVPGSAILSVSQEKTLPTCCEILESNPL